MLAIYTHIGSEQCVGAYDVVLDGLKVAEARLSVCASSEHGGGAKSPQHVGARRA